MGNASATDLRLQLLAHSIEPLPSTVGKEVFLTDWSERAITETEIRSWEHQKDWPSTSVRTARHPCLDLDIKDEAAVDACEALVRDKFDGLGELLVRTGLAPKRLIPFALRGVPFTKRLMCYIAPNKERYRIEFLGDGQQAVFYGYHTGAQRDYLWRANRDPLTVPPPQWVTITEMDVDELMTALDELLVEQFGYERVRPDTANGHASSAVHVTDVAAALVTFHYAGQGGNGNIHDVSIGCINALIVENVAADNAVAEVEAALRAYASTNPLCARWSWERERRRLEEMAFSFINKFSDYVDRLPPDFYAVRQIRRGQGVLEPKLEYDRLRKCWHYPEPPGPNLHVVDGDKGAAPLGNGTTAPKAAPEQKFRLVPFGQLRPGNDPGYLVDELIPLRGIVLIWGKRKCLKSFWTYDLSFHVAHYQEYRGRSVLQGVVVYCAFEGAHGYKKRTEALRRFHKIPDNQEVPLYLVPGRANMIREYPLLISAVREQLLGKVPRMIVLDTLNKSLVGSESKDTDMASRNASAATMYAGMMMTTQSKAMTLPSGLVPLPIFPSATAACSARRYASSVASFAFSGVSSPVG